MAKTQASAPRLDHFFSAVAARLDLWRDLSRAAQAWAASPASRGDAGLQAACSEALTAVLPLEDFQAYPGAARAERHQGARGGRRRDGHGAARAARLVGADVAQLPQRCGGVRGGGRRGQPGARDADRAGRGGSAALLRGAVRDAHAARRAGPRTSSRSGSCGAPRTSSSTSPCSSARSRTRLLAVILNTNLESVVIYDGFPYASSHDVPLLKSLLSLAAVRRRRRTARRAPTACCSRSSSSSFRPELDIILLADRKPDAILADPAAAGLRRVFYEVEEPLEIHLSILAGVAERYETPFFDNLKKYAQKPVGTFHALPVARGKSIFKSNWIRDMGEFYGPTCSSRSRRRRRAGSTACSSPRATSRRPRTRPRAPSAPTACSS